VNTSCLIALREECLVDADMSKAKRDGGDREVKAPRTSAAGAHDRGRLIEATFQVPEPVSERFGVVLT
jgi:hypothetical protein